MQTRRPLDWSSAFGLRFLSAGLPAVGSSARRANDETHSSDIYEKEEGGGIFKRNRKPESARTPTMLPDGIFRAKC